MNISILAPNLSNNCMGRAYLLAKVLQRHFEVEIIGPVFGEGIWPPVSGDESINYRSIEVDGWFRSYKQIKKLAEMIDGDVIYAIKPLFSSFGIGLLKKWISRKPLILDIDDWQMGFIKNGDDNFTSNDGFKIKSKWLSIFFRKSYWEAFIFEKLRHFADGITVSNSFLNRRFGGSIVWHGRDTSYFNPEKFDRDLFKKKYEIKADKKIVMFFGTPNSHKGLDDLVRAVSSTENKNIILMVVGIDNGSFNRNFVKFADSILKERFIRFGLQPFETIPEFMAMADVVVIPQKRSYSTLGQVPAKVFDAMAMAKPIIATNVSDLPDILKNCGWIVQPGNPARLKKAIDYVISNPKEAQEMGLRARKKCVDNYNWDKLEKKLIKVFRKYE